jgi:hypothetical protein
VVELGYIAARLFERSSHKEALEEDGGRGECELREFEHDAALDDEVDAFGAELSLLQ